MALKKPLETHFDYFWALLPKWLSGSLLGIPIGLQGSPRSPPEMRDATESFNPEVQMEGANES